MSGTGTGNKAVIKEDFPMSGLPSGNYRQISAH